MRRWFVLVLVMAVAAWASQEGEEEAAVNKKPQYVRPVVNGVAYFVETFESNTIGTKLVGRPHTNYDPTIV